MDRETPVAEIHPYRKSGPEKANSVWGARHQVEKLYGNLEEDFELPARSTAPHKHKNPLD